MNWIFRNLFISITLGVAFFSSSNNFVSKYGKFNNDLIYSNTIHNEEHVSESQSEDVDKHRIYIYFPNIRPIEDTTWFKGYFFSSDGKEYSDYAVHCPSVSLQGATLHTRILYIDIPDYSEICYFELGSLKHSTVWTRSPLNKISGSWFIFNINSYDKLEDDSRWEAPQIRMIDFADCIISNLNENIESTTYGYNSYPYLANSIFKNLTDYDEEKSKTITWTDVYSNENISLYDKWNSLKTNYKNSPKSVSTSWFHWEYFIGVSIIAFSVFLFVRSIVKERKEHEYQ